MVLTFFIFNTLDFQGILMPVSILHADSYLNMPIQIRKYGLLILNIVAIPGTLLILLLSRCWGAGWDLNLRACHISTPALQPMSYAAPYNLLFL
jgi:hypothetical protein